MSCSLPVGNWAWQQRWTYPAQERHLPYASEQFANPKSVPGSRSGSKAETKSPSRFPPAFPSSPSVKVRGQPVPKREHNVPFRPHFAPTTTSYLEIFAPPSGVVPDPKKSRQSLINRIGVVKDTSVLRGKKGAPDTFLHHHMGQFRKQADELNRVEPQHASFRLWGRLNPGHCVVPYITSSQLQCKEHKVPDQDRRYYMRVIRKDYKEAIARAKNIERDNIARQSQDAKA